MATKKLIEVALPLGKINEACAREKSIRHGHPSTLHLWWARRPLAAARAVIWASLVDDPSSHPEQFPTEKDQYTERQRLFKILEDLVLWENSNNRTVLDTAYAEIIKSTGGVIPELLDPFAGGGAIPLEAQRLGLKAHAHDLNPVAIMINKAMIEVPSRFSNNMPVNIEDRGKIGGKQAWEKTTGLAADVRYYAELLKRKVFTEVGHNYPNVKIPKKYGDGEATVIAWIWARTISCPNPACGCEMPLVKSFDLSKKKSNPFSIKMQIQGNQIDYIVEETTASDEGTVARSGGHCPCCGSPVDFNYIRKEASEHRMGAQLMATVAEGKKGRIYLSPDDEQRRAAVVERPAVYPTGTLSGKCRVNVSLYGFDETSDLFTNRQLATLTCFSNMVSEVERVIEEDAKLAGLSDDHISLANGGMGALAYSQAIGIYLAFIIDKMADYQSSVCSWNPPRDGLRNTFGRQAIPMVWDYAEGNPFSHSSGCFDNMLEWIEKCILELPGNITGEVSQYDAQSDCGLRNLMISTDPPYYDNISYADLSDYFYVWMRNSIKNTYPDIFRTMLVPKVEELVATPYRFDGNVEQAKTFFEEGMFETCKQIYKYSRDDIPVTVYYAYKQSDTSVEDDVTKTASTGWETILSAIIRAGFSITGTWPMSTERASRNVGIGANALASSIVLVCRKRSEDAPQTTRRNLVSSLRRELRPALKKLQDSNIAPVDLAQSAIGPGMGVFSRYRRVLEADGTPMTVRSALQVINEEIDLYFNEQVGEMDTASRFCVDLYTQNAYNDIKYGEAEVLANAKGTSIPMMASHGVLYAKAGVVHLIDRSELPTKVDMNEGNVWMLTQQFTHAMATGGVEACAQIILNMFGSNAERAKDLAYRLYTIAEQKKWANEAYAYNALVVAWPDIQSRAAALKAVQPKQLSFFDMI